MPEFCQKARLPVFMCYVLRANERRRAWPSIATLMAETGYGRAYVVAAKQWLVEVGALAEVPINQRRDDEVSTHRCDVMQVTGKAKIGGKKVNILFSNSSQSEILNSSNSSLSEPLSGNSSHSEPSNSSESELVHADESNSSHSEPEVITSSGSLDQDIAIKDSAAGAAESPKPSNGKHASKDLKNTDWTDLILQGSFGIRWDGISQLARGVDGKVKNILRELNAIHATIGELKAVYVGHRRSMDEAKAKGEQLERIQSPGAISTRILSARQAAIEDEQAGPERIRLGMPS